MVFKTLDLRGMVVGPRRMFEALVDAAAASGLTPPIDRTFPFDEAPAAYAYLQAGGHVGKVMITL
jgi:NADPH:quinone reductase-like Zn-dependent oxidoreductase